MTPSRLAALLTSAVLAAAALAGPTTTSAGAVTAPTASVAIQVLPQIVATAVNDTPEPAKAALSTVTAAFTPAESGRLVVLEVMAGKRWREVARSAEDTAGRVTFNAPYTYAGAPASYRIVAPSTPAADQTISATVRTDVWGVPILSDDFSKNALSYPWDHRYQGYDIPSRLCSKTDASAATVGSDVLTLSVLVDVARSNQPCTFTNKDGVEQSTFYRLNGHVGTQGRFSYRYGVAAARIKFQYARGQHGSFWMQPAGTGYGAEIDVMTWFGTDSLGLVNGVHDYSLGPRTRVAGGTVVDQASYGTDWATKYHVFSVEWTDKEYVFRIDGKEQLRTTAGVSQTEQYLILSLLVSNIEAQKISPESLPQTMAVDWVRVWQQQ